MNHYAVSPEWGWYIVWYFYLGGIAGGAWFLGALLRLSRNPEDERAARLAFGLSFVAMAICPILLTLDLGLPMRFWHMMVDSVDGSINLKPASPMSVGVWVLVVFSLFATVAFVDLLWPLPFLRRGGAGRAFHVLGAAFGLALAGYTGVLLSVSNQPLWSDTWALGGLFLASGLSVATASLGLLAAWRRIGGSFPGRLLRAARWFLLLELALLGVFFATLGSVARRSHQSTPSRHACGQSISHTRVSGAAASMTLSARKSPCTRVEPTLAGTPWGATSSRAARFALSHGPCSPTAVSAASTSAPTASRRDQPAAR